MQKKGKPARKSRTVAVNAAVLAALIANQLIEIVPEKYGKWLAFVVAVINLYLRFKTSEPIEMETPTWFSKTVRLGTILSKKRK